MRIPVEFIEKRQQLAIGVLLVALLSPLKAADPWLRVSTPHFEMYTTAGEKKGREAILHFEQVRSFFFAISPKRKESEFPVRIIAFRSEKEYAPFRLSESGHAFYTSSRKRDYIVMQDISERGYPTAIHEYVHLVVRHSGLRLPVWLNEGFAEVYSTLRPVGKQALIGEIMPGRAQMLLTGKWIDLGVLTEVDHKSPYYNEKEKAGMFYSESWALTHMLYLSPEYKQKFNEFLALVAAGKPAAEALPAAYGKPMGVVQQQLRNYFRRPTLYGGVADVKLDKSAEEPEVSAVAEPDADLVLADLHLATGRAEAARAIYERLARTHAGRAEIEESLGYLALQENDQAGAKSHFARAVAGNTKNPQLCYHYAVLEGGDGDSVVSALEKSLSLKPDYVEARLLLGNIYLQRKRYSEALGHLSQVRSVDGDQAWRLFYVLALTHLHLKSTEGARKNAELAKRWARSPGETLRAEGILRHLDQPAGELAVEPMESSRASEDGPRLVRRPTSPVAETPAAPKVKLEHAEGTAVLLECMDKVARLHISTPQGNLVFEIRDPEQVDLKHPGGSSAVEFKCGPQNPSRVEVEYLPEPDSRNRVAGIVRALTFR